VLGVDIGGVILRRADYREEDFGPRGPLQGPLTEIAGASSGLQRLGAERFGAQIFLVSKCAPRTQAWMQDWLTTHDFFDRTGLPGDHVRFCRERRQKAGICDELGVTHFVDDRLEVLSYLEGVGTRYLFDPEPDEMRQFSSHLSSVTVVHEWGALCDGLLTS
jgi:hypothetical protein